VSYKRIRSGRDHLLTLFNLYDAANNLLATSGTLQLGPTPTFLPSGYLGWNVTTVGVVGYASIRVMDDVTYEVAGAPVVPEPASLLLLGTGLVGLARWRRRRH
jgi:hypothetical protein